jgi:hypothetical protein
METDSSIPAPLPVIRIICDAFQFVWDRRTRLLYALAVPVALLLVVDHAFTLANKDPLKFVQAFIQMAIYILFAITCHRVALIGDEGVPHYGLRSWSLRESRYLGWSVIILVVWLLFSFVVNSFYVSMIVSKVEAGASAETYQSYKYWLTPFYIPILYILSRLSVLCPAIALDQKVDAQWVWRLTAHNGWRLTVIVSLMPWVLYFVLNLLLRENATFVESIILQLLGFILLAVEVVALSFCYKHLAKAEA